MEARGIPAGTAGMGSERQNVFSGNPLIPEKQDKVTASALLPRVARAQAEAARCVLPVSKGRVLVWSRDDKSDSGATETEWGLAWQTLQAVGVDLDTTAGEDSSAQVSLTVDDLIYLGEKHSRPYFAVELQVEEGAGKAPVPSSLSAPSPLLQQLLIAPSGTSAAKALQGHGEGDSADSPSSLSFVDLRTLFLAADPTNAYQMAELAISGQARAFVEWHKQTRFCGTCGSRTVPAEAGCRRACTSSSCKAKAYPRIDPVVIMLILDPARDRVVLARQPRFPKGMWSCPAGFMEIGESLEESVRREVREEVGLEVARVVYHSSQPWPVGFGNMLCQLMVGFFAEVSTFDIKVEKDELEDARWFSRDEVIEGLNFAVYEQERREAGARIHAASQRDRSREQQVGQEAKIAPPGGLLDFYLPGPFAIAHQLLKDWAFSNVTGNTQSSL